MNPLRAFGAFMLVWGAAVICMSLNGKKSSDSEEEIIAQFKFALIPSIGAFLFAL